MADPIVVRLTTQVRSYPKGTELGFTSEAEARKTLGDDTFTVVSLQNGQPAPEKATRKASTDGKK